MEAEAFAKGEQPISIGKDGRLSGDAPPERPPHFYISKLETMIDKLEQRIDALNNAYETSETSSEDNLNSYGSLVAVSGLGEQTQKSEKSGELVIGDDRRILNVPTHTFQFKEIEIRAMRKFGDGSCITNTNAMNALVRCLNWCEVFIKDDGRRTSNVAYIRRTIEMTKQLCSLVAEGWRAEAEDYDAIGERMDEIMEHGFSV
jgi:hypothetical protein